MDIRIYYEDTDCGGVVYYANYLRYFERARTQYFEERALSVADLLKGGAQFMVVHAELDYRSPARYGDTLTIETRLARSGRASLTFAHVVRERASGRIAVEGSATLVAVDQEGRVKRLAPSLVEALQRSPAADGDHADGRGRPKAGRGEPLARRVSRSSRRRHQGGR